MKTDVGIRLTSQSGRRKRKPPEQSSRPPGSLQNDHSLIVRRNDGSSSFAGLADSERSNSYPSFFGSMRELQESLQRPVVLRDAFREYSAGCELSPPRMTAAAA
jgi:hypothetical protein